MPAAKPFAGRDTLLEREIEANALEELIGAASGDGGLLVLEGPPGIGKTSLNVGKGKPRPDRRA